MVIHVGCICGSAFFVSVDEIFNCDYSDGGCGNVYCARWFYLLSLWRKSLSVTIQMKAIEQCFSCGAVYHAVQSGSNFCVCGENLKCDH